MAHTRSQRGRARALSERVAWPLLALAVGLGLAAYSWPFTVDDAFIVARYARRLAAGEGYTFQPGTTSDGVTGPLWLLPLAFGVRLGWDAIVTGKLVGVACAAAVPLVLARESWGRAGDRVRGPFLAGLLASAAPLWIWAIGGLETAPATLCLTVMSLAAIARPAPRVWRVGVCAALLPWLRPELVPLALTAVAWSVQRARRRALLPALVALAGLGAVLAFRFTTFGHFLPLSAYAKPASLAHGVDYLWTCLRSPAALSLVPLLWLALRWGRSADRALLFALLMHACVVACAGGDWMAGARLFVPVVPVACFVAAVAWGRLLQRRRAVALGLALCVLALRGMAAHAETSAARASGVLREQRLPALLAALQGVPDPIALLDIGAVGYWTNRSVVDLGGLTDTQIAYAPGGHIAKRIDAAWLEARAPGAIVLHSRVLPRVDENGHVRWFAGYPVERHVLSLPWVARNYRARSVIAYHRDYFYLVLTRAAPSAP